MTEYRALPHDERTALRRAAFGAPGFEAVTAGFDLEALRAMLVAENARELPTKWTDTADEEH